MAKGVIELLAEISEKLSDNYNLNALTQYLDVYKFLGQMIELGAAYTDIGSYSLAIAPGATTTLAGANPAGYVWIPHWEAVRVSRANVLTLQVIRDGRLLLWMPGVCDFDFEWSTRLPYMSAVLQTFGIVYTNTDVLQQWVVAGWIGTYLRMEEYQKYRAALTKIASEHWLGVWK